MDPALSDRSLSAQTSSRADAASPAERRRSDPDTWSNAGNAGDRPKLKAENSPCCTLHLNATREPLYPTHGSTGFTQKWDRSPIVVFRLPTRYSYSDPETGEQRGASLTEEECKGLYTHALDRLAPGKHPKDLNFAESEYSSRRSKLNQYITICADEWYASFSSPLTPCAQKYSAQPRNGFKLPPGLNTKLIQINTGDSGVYFNPIKAENSVFIDTNDQFRSQFTPETHTLLNSDHQCHCILRDWQAVGASHNTETGVTQIQYALVAQTCSGALCSPSIELLSHFHEPLTAVVEKPSREVAAVAGWQQGKISEALRDELVTVGQRVFEELGLHSDCSKLVPTTGPSLVWRSREFRLSDDYDVNGDWLDTLVASDSALREHPGLFRQAGRDMEARLKPMLRLPDVTKVQCDTAIRKAIEETFDGMYFKDHKFLKDQSEESLNCRTDVEVCLASEVPDRAKHDDDNASHYIKTSGSIRCTRETRGLEFEFPPEPTWFRYTPVSRGTTGIQRKTEVIPQRKLVDRGNSGEGSSA